MFYLEFYPYTSIHIVNCSSVNIYNQNQVQSESKKKITSVQCGSPTVIIQRFKPVHLCTKHMQDCYYQLCAYQYQNQSHVSSLYLNLEAHTKLALANSDTHFFFNSCAPCLQARSPSAIVFLTRVDVYCLILFVFPDVLPF